MFEMKSLLTILLGTILWIGSGIAQSAIICEPEDEHKIQASINMANNGDIVVAANGTYHQVLKSNKSTDTLLKPQTQRSDATIDSDLEKFTPPKIYILSPTAAAPAHPRGGPGIFVIVFHPSSGFKVSNISTLLRHGPCRL